jgi:hypothetical protein
LFVNHIFMIDKDRIMLHEAVVKLKTACRILPTGRFLFQFIALQLFNQFPVAEFLFTRIA